MLKIKLNLRNVIAIAISLAGITMFASCDKDKQSRNNEGTEPDGTVLVSMRNENNGKSYVDLSPLTCIYIDKADNFWEYYGSGLWTNVGKVGGLADVKKITTNGWGNRASVEPGYGYILYHNNNYFRLYVVDYIYAAGTNGVIGAKVKYQGPFKPENSESGNSENVWTNAENQIIVNTGKTYQCKQEGVVYTIEIVSANNATITLKLNGVSAVLSDGYYLGEGLYLGEGYSFISKSGVGMFQADAQANPANVLFAKRSGEAKLTTVTANITKPIVGASNTVFIAD